MPEATSIITEIELLDKLRNSKIDKSQQKELENMIPEMNQEDREELINLIERANAESKTVPTPAVTEESDRKKHILRNVILIVIALIAIATGILYALNIL